jgi:hypothetical protein
MKHASCFARTLVFAAACYGTALACGAQAVSSATPAPAAAPSPLTESGFLTPALDRVQQTLGALRLERWKKGEVRDEVADEIGDIERDLKETLPPLLHEADANPGTVSKALPVSRNIDALYDVLLRVVETARFNAPADQVAELQKALTGLADARRDLDNRLQGSADAVAVQVVTLQKNLQAQAAARAFVPPAPVVRPCPTPAPHRRVKKKAKPPATTKPASSAPAATTPKASVQ